jgi:hypothetical protein
MINCYDRLGSRFGLPGMTQEALLTTIDLYGRTVIPRVRQLLDQAAAESLPLP